MNTYDPKILRNFEAEALAARGEMDALAEEIEVARKDLDLARAAIAPKMREQIERGALADRRLGLNPSDPAKEFARRDAIVVDLVDRLRALQERRAAAGERHAEFRTLWRRLDEFVKAGRLKAWPGSARPLVEANDPRALADGEKRVAKLREKLAKAKTQRAEVSRTMVPRNIADARLMQTIERAVEAFDHGAEGLTRADAGAMDLVGWLTGDDRPQTVGGFMWLFADRLVERFSTELDLIYASSPPTLTDEQRRARIAAIDAEIFAVEVQEEELIVTCAVSGLRLKRRSDARPEILLRLAASATLISDAADDAA